MQRVADQMVFIMHKDFVRRNVVLSKLLLRSFVRKWILGRKDRRSRHPGGKRLCRKSEGNFLRVSGREKRRKTSALSCSVFGQFLVKCSFCCRGISRGDFPLRQFDGMRLHQREKEKNHPYILQRTKNKKLSRLTN